MIKNLRSLAVVIFIFTSALGYAQKPSISYPGPQIYTVGVPIAALFPVNIGGDPDPHGYSVSPALPQGLTFNVSDGTIMGTPTVAAITQNYIISAKNASGTGTYQVSITVNPIPKPNITYKSPQIYTVNTPIDVLTPTSAGGVVQKGGFSVTPALPQGLSIDADNGVITGTPTVASSAREYTVTATNSSGSATALINIIVNEPGPPKFIYPGNVANPPSYAYTSGGNITITPVSTGVSQTINYGSSNFASGIDALQAVTLGRDGAVYILQQSLGMVKKINADGSNPQIIASNLNSPAGLAVDAAGNVYVTENAGNTIKKIMVNGGPIVTIASGLSAPYAIAVDTLGTIYFTNMGNGTIEMIPAGGGNPSIIAQGLNTPTGIALDAYGTIYFAERDHNLIKKIPAGTNTIQTIGSAFGKPAGVTADNNGNVYFADPTSSAVGVFRPGSSTATSFGLNLSAPVSVAVDVKGNVFVGDFNSQSIRKLNPLGGYFISPALPHGLSIDQHTGTISGIVTAAKPETSYTVIGYNAAGSYENNFTIRITPRITLSNLTISNGTMFPAFTSANTVYTVAVDNTVASVTLTPTAATGTSLAILVNGAPVPSGTASPIIPLTGGKTKITVTTNATTGSKTDSYTIIVSKGLSSNNTLTSLTTNSNNALSPAFSAGTKNYGIDNSSSPTIILTPVAANADEVIKINNLPVSSGSPSPPIAANRANIVVTAADGTERTYTISIQRLITSPPAVSNLFLLGFSDALLLPEFNSDKLNYTVFVPLDRTSQTITPISSGGGQITVNGVSCASGRSISVKLSGGTTTVSIKVKENNVVPKTYTITVIKGNPASNITLANMVVNNATISPVFAPDQAHYAATVNYDVSSITIAPTTADPSATVKVNGIAVASGAASDDIALAVGTNIINTEVTAQDGTTVGNYTLSVTRSAPTAALSQLILNGATLSPAFTPDVLNYTASVASTTASINLVPTPVEAHATIIINGIPVAPGATSQDIALTVGTNVINTAVTAEDGTTTRSYSITVNRESPENATLSNLAVNSTTISPAFAPGSVHYTASVAYTTTSIAITPTATDAAAIINVNGAPVASGTTSGSIELMIGANTINTVVISEDGTATKTYTLTVTRAAPPSANAVLSSLVLSGVAVSPSFSPGIARYTASVANTVTSLKVTPTTIDPTATVKVNGVAVASGTASGAVPLVVGSNVITTQITAQDGTSIRNYTVTVTRAPSTNAVLANMVVNGATISPSFSPGIARYTASVDNSVSSITISPTVIDATATIKVNEVAVMSGATSGPIALAVGTNTINTVTTAQDGVSQRTYTVTITRAAPPISTNAVLAHLVLNGGIISPSFSSGIARYTSAVSNATATVSVTPTTVEAHATIKVNGVSVVSGATSQNIALAVGSNVITTQVTAQDGISIRTYTITVTRSAPSGMALATDQPDNSATADGITVHQSISPNGDGNNDILLIDGISAFPDNNMVIFDRSGGLVFNAKGYNNGTVVFDGHSSQNGKLQQPGTYFYTLDYKTGEVKKHKTGYILIKY